MFRPRVKLFLTGDSTQKINDRYYVNLVEPIRDVINVSVKQFRTTAWIGTNPPVCIFLVSDLATLTRNINSSSGVPSLILAMAVADFDFGHLYISQYLDDRKQNRIDIQGFWFELLKPDNTPVPLSPSVQWNFCIELEFCIANERDFVDRL